MWYLLLALILLGAFSAIIALFPHNKGDGEDVITIGTDCATCSGENARCEQECMMEAAVREVEYFDDEELDAYRGRPGDGYTDEEAEQFREVAYTMQPAEVRPWTRSLTLRGIELPNQVKEEVILLIDNG